MTNLLEARSAARFANLLDNPAGRATTSAHRAADETDRMLGVTTALTRIPQPTADRDFRTGLRAQLIATADRDGIGDLADHHEPAPPPRRRSLFARRRAAILAGLTIGVVTISGVSLASGGANPGDTLYGVKRGTEQAQLAIAGSDQARGALYLQLAGVRLTEALAVRTDITGFSGALSDMDLDTLTGVRLLTTWATNHSDSTALDTIDTFATTQHATIEQLLQLVRDNPKAIARATTSLALLDAVTERARTLRTAVGCKATVTGQTDALGPIAGACTTTTSPAGQTTVTVGSGGEVTVHKPAGSGLPVPTPAPGGQPATSTSPLPQPSPSTSTDGGLLGDVGRILGGLLGS